MSLPLQFDTLADDIVAEILAHCDSAADIQSFRATCKRAASQTESDRFWQRACCARWPQYAEALLAIKTNREHPAPSQSPTTKNAEEEEELHEIGGVSYGQVDLAEDAARVAIGTHQKKVASWRQCYYFRDSYESLAHLILDGETKDEMRRAPPGPVNIARFFSDLYTESLLNFPALGSQNWRRLIQFSTACAARSALLAEARWNMGKFISILAKSSESGESNDDAPSSLLHRYFGLFPQQWLPHLALCLTVKPGPSAAPNFYLAQETNGLVHLLIKRSFEASPDRASEIVWMICRFALARLGAFLGSPATHSEAEVVGSLEILDFAATSIPLEHFSMVKRHVPVDLADWPQVEALIQRLLTFLKGQEYKDAKTVELERADPHHAHYRIRHLPAISMPIYAHLAALIVDFSSNIQASKQVADKFVSAMKDFISPSLPFHLNEAIQGVVQANQIFSEAISNSNATELFHYVGTCLLNSLRDHPSKMLALHLARSYVSGDAPVPPYKFEPFMNHYLKDAVDEFVDQTKGSFFDASLLLLSTMVCLPEGDHSDYPYVAENLVDILLRAMEPLTGDGGLTQDNLHLRDAAIAANIVTILFTGFPKKTTDIVSEKPEVAKKLFHCTSELVQCTGAQGTSLLGLLALNCAAVLGDQSVPTVFEQFLHQIRDLRSEEAESGSVALWAISQCYYNFPQLIKQHMPRIISSLDGFRTHAREFASNAVLVWSAMALLDPTVTMDALKRSGNGFFFGSQLSRMHLEKERSFAILAVKKLLEIDQLQMKKWIIEGLEPEKNAEELERLRTRKEQQADWNARQEQAFSQNNYDFGNDEESRRPRDFELLRKCTPAQRAKWVAIIREQLPEIAADLAQE